MNESWDLVARVLSDAGCSFVIGVPSDEYGLLDAARATGTMQSVAVRDQRVAGCSAIAYATLTGVPAVLALTTGPSFASAIVAVSEAASLCVPLIVVTTRVSSANRGRGAFQELDQIAVSAPLVKWSFTVERPEQLVWALRRACYVSRCGAPGATLVELASELSGLMLPGREARQQLRIPRSLPPPDELQRASELLESAKRPALVAGGGAKACGAGAAIIELARVVGAAVFTTATGRGVVDETCDEACGLVGLYATPPADQLLAGADVVIAVGTRLEETARMGWPSLLDAKVLQIDADPAALHGSNEPALALLGDARLTLEALVGQLARSGRRPRSADPRLAAAKSAMRRSAADFVYASNPVPVVLRRLNQTYADGATFVCDNGLHDMWAYHHPLLEIRDRDGIVVPGEQTMMGFAPMAAPGAAIACPSRPTVVLCGDGSFSVAFSAVVSAAELCLPITYVVFDNGALGWPKHTRDIAGIDSAIADLAHCESLEAIVRSLNGFVAAPANEAEMKRALLESKKRAGLSIALVRIAVPITDVPVGVTRVMGTAAAG